MQARQQVVEGDEAGAAAEDAIEARTQCGTTLRAGSGPIIPEVGTEPPDQPAEVLLRATVQVVEGIQFVHQPFRMHPAQCMVANRKLSGIVTSTTVPRTKSCAWTLPQIAPPAFAGAGS